MIVWNHRHLYLWSIRIGQSIIQQLHSAEDVSSAEDQLVHIRIFISLYIFISFYLQSCLNILNFPVQEFLLQGFPNAPLFLLHIHTLRKRRMLHKHRKGTRDNNTGNRGLHQFLPLLRGLLRGVRRTRESLVPRHLQLNIGNLWCVLLPKNPKGKRRW